MTGQRGDDSWGCIAWAIDKSGELLKSPEITIKMAKEEGWFHRSGSKWKTLPELMLCYRSATLFTRLYAPEITMGIQTTEEVVDMGPEVNGPPSRPIFESECSGPKFEPKSKTQAEDDISMHFQRQATSVGQKPGDAPPPEAVTAPAPVAPPTPMAAPKAQNGQYNYLKALTGLIGLSKHSEANVLTFLRNTRKCDESLTSLAEVAGKHASLMVWTHDNWKAVDREITRLKQNTPI